MSYFGNARYHDQYRHGPRRSRWLAVLSCINLLAVLTVAGLLTYLSEDWWVSTALVYLPKVPLAIPAGVLLLWSLLTWSRWCLPNVLSLSLVLWPIMGLVAPTSRLTAPAPTLQPDDVRVVSCNIQGFQPSFPLVVAELLRHSPDIVAFQEVRGDDHPLLAKAFAGWHVARQDYYWVGSKYPVRLLRVLESPSFERSVGLLVEVELPTGPIQIANIHLMTARRSLAELTVPGLFNGEDRDIIERHQVLREQEMQDIRAQIDDYRAALPRIVLGDFNTPSSSSLFRRWWGDFQSAFDRAGFGYGYTSPCRQHTHWLNNTPWVRIDHVLCSAEWEVVACGIGTEDGSDHRLIAATLRPRGVPAHPNVSDDAGLDDRTPSPSPTDSTGGEE